MTGAQDSGSPVNPETLIRVTVPDEPPQVVAARDILGGMDEYGWECDEESEDAIVRLLTTGESQTVYGQDGRYIYEFFR